MRYSHFIDHLISITQFIVSTCNLLLSGSTGQIADCCVHVYGAVSDGLTVRVPIRKHKNICKFIFQARSRLKLLAQHECNAVIGKK